MITDTFVSQGIVVIKSVPTGNGKSQDQSIVLILSYHNRTKGICMD